MLRVSEHRGRAALAGKHEKEMKALILDEIRILPKPPVGSHPARIVGVNARDWGPFNGLYLGI